jgi:hypothetical protein
MPKFIVLHKYRSDTFGPWEPGAVIELTEEQAAWVQHDSPGCLMPAHEETALNDQKPITGEPKDKETKPEEPDETDEEPKDEDKEPESWPADEPPVDRQIKEPPKRRQDRQGDPSDQGPITKADFKATKD